MGELLLFSAEDQVRLSELEKVIEQHVEKFISVGLALSEINTQRLYRRDFDTFEEYCEIRWEIKRRTAYQYIEAYAVYENVRHGAQIEILPKNERQVRPLIALKTPEDQAAVWSSAVDSAPDGKVTAAIVQSAVRRFLGDAAQSKARQAAKTVEETVLPEEFKKLFFAMVEFIRKTRDSLGKRNKSEMRRYIDNLSDLLTD